MCPACGTWGSFLPCEEKSPVRKEVQTYALGDAFFGLVEAVPPGSLILLGGEPGVGKSTLALRVAGECRKFGGVVYVCAEERAEVVEARARRVLGDPRGIVFVEEPLVRRALAAARGAALLVVDSLQVVTPRASLLPGRPEAQREAEHELLRWARREGACVLIVTQVSKRGLAGPRAVEHMVDVVLVLRRAQGELRALELVKSRFGPAPRAVLLRMEPTGLVRADTKKLAGMPAS